MVQTDIQVSCFPRPEKQKFGKGERNRRESHRLMRIIEHLHSTQLTSQIEVQMFRSKRFDPRTFISGIQDCTQTQD